MADETGESGMTTDVHNIFKGMGAEGMSGVGAGAGAGLGAGLLGGVLGGALLGNRGLLGGGGVGEGVVTPSQLTAALAGVTAAQANTTVLQTLGDIKASVPLAEGQVQLALAGATASLITGQSLINKNISEAIAASLASQNNINVNVLTQGSQTRETVANFGVANLNATKDAQFATVTAVANSTKEILAALNTQNMDNLNRQLTIAETALLERNAALRARETEINITNTNTATATAQQAQFQGQQQFQILAQLSAAVSNLANDVQVVRQGQTIFNSGTMAASGTQAAANTRVN